ncbi:MAG: Zn-dependent alcohol dehydrogenase [Lentisphaeraceae bacterium]|nr:Zn-dependent alcohol dehydrogenase [Lentisphaeraceae bacterium]
MTLSKAIVTNGDGSFSIKETEIAAPKKDELLIKVEASGVCHTDFDSMSWGQKLIMGHEGAGTVSAVGPDVNDFKVGDKVILNWAIPCGHCSPCSDGHQNICEENSFVTGKGHGHSSLESTICDTQPIKRSFHLGTMAEYTLVREAAVCHLQENIPYTSACIIGCGVMTGVGSVWNATNLTAGSSAAILGCGGVGLNVIQACKIAGASKIIAIDVAQEKLDLAREFGATHFVLAPKSDPNFSSIKKSVQDLTNNRGADYSFECTAIPELGAAPLALIKNSGTAIQVSGIEQKINFDCELFEWDKIYLNPLYGKCNPQKDFPKIQDFYLSGALKLDELVSKTYTINQLQNAFDDMHNGKIAKAVIVFN